MTRTSASFTLSLVVGAHRPVVPAAAPPDFDVTRCVRQTERQALHIRFSMSGSDACVRLDLSPRTSDQNTPYTSERASVVRALPEVTKSTADAIEPAVDHSMSDSPESRAAAERFVDMIVEKLPEVLEGHLDGMRDAIADIQRTVEAFESRVDDLEEGPSVGRLDDRLDDVEATQTDLEERFQEIESVQEGLESARDADTETVMDLQKEIRAELVAVRTDCDALRAIVERLDGKGGARRTRAKAIPDAKALTEAAALVPDNGPS